MIQSHQLSKNFVSYKKLPGFSGTFKSFFNREEVVKKAVEEFNLNIKKGELVGLLGPNGAGKTTLMKMFTGIIVPSAGTLTVAGHQPEKRSKEFRKKIALVMGQKTQLWWDIPAMDSFQLLKRYYEISTPAFNDKIAQMGELLNVNHILNTQVRKLSLGERMKLELMASLLHSPEVIFLDEPTIGLDLIAQENIRNFIADYHRLHQITIVLTSHYMADIQALCKRLVLIFDGKKSFDGPISNFEKILGDKKSVTFLFDNPQNHLEHFWQNFDLEWSENYRQVELQIPAPELREVTGQVLEKFPVVDFSSEKLPIEKVMKTLMKNPSLLDHHEN